MKKNLFAFLIALAMLLCSGFATADTNAEVPTDDILANFELLAQIPRQSGHEQAISDFLKAWAEGLGYMFSACR